MAGGLLTCPITSAPTNITDIQEAIWYAWHTNCTTCANTNITVSTDNTAIYTQWHQDFLRNVYPQIVQFYDISSSNGVASLPLQIQVPSFTEEQKAQRDREVKEAQRIMRRTRAKYRLASMKADKLLLRHLSSEQAKDLKSYGFFKLYVQKDGVTKTYCIRRGTHQNIDLVEEKGNKIIVVQTLCAGPAHRVPAGDAMLAQKLLLETDETQFLQIANKFAPLDPRYYESLRRAA